MASFVERWESLGSGLRILLIAGIALIAAFTIVAFWWLTSEEYRVLFSDLEPRDASSIVSALEEMKVDYRLAEVGTKIEVPESVVYNVRLKLMGSDVPLVGGAGFEIFNDSDFGMTEFSQRINYQRALEGELTRTIVSLKEVKYARVHLVLPERGIFKREDNPSSASVTLFLHAPHQLAPKQVVGIQRLVAAGVPGLEASQVTVTDQNGLTLSPKLPVQEGVAAVSERLRQKQAVESYLVNKATEVLVRHFGDSRAMVSIDADLEFNQVKRALENVLPADNQKESGIVRRRETRLGSSGTAQATPGDMTTEVEYRLGRAIEQIVETPGKIIRLSVGVMVPATASEEQKQKIRELVKMAVGYDASRGDAIAIYALNISAGKPAGGDMGLVHENKDVEPSVRAEDGRLVDNKDAAPTAKDHLFHVDSIRKWLSASKENYFLGLSIVIAVLILCGIAIGLGRRRKIRRSQIPELSESERQRLLENIQSWLGQKESAKESESV
jgi:flagellar M-ring protein FliF